MNKTTLLVLKWIGYAVAAVIVLYLLFGLLRAVREQLAKGVQGIGSALGNIFHEFSPLGLLDQAATAVREWKQNLFGSKQPEVIAGVSSNDDGTFTATTNSGDTFTVNPAIVPDSQDPAVQEAARKWVWNF